VLLVLCQPPLLLSTLVRYRAALCHWHFIGFLYPSSWPITTFALLSHTLGFLVGTSGTPPFGPLPVGPTIRGSCLYIAILLGFWEPLFLRCSGYLLYRFLPLVLPRPSLVYGL